MQPAGGPTPPGAAGGANPNREAGFLILQHYRKLNVPQPLLLRVRNHLVFYFRQGGNLPELEQMVLAQNMPPQQLLQLIESKVGRPHPLGPPGGGAPGAAPPAGTALRPPPPPPSALPPSGAAAGAPGGRTCAYCGGAIPPGAATCPGCSAPVG